jgi:hypothetical protein
VTCSRTLAAWAAVISFARPGGDQLAEHGDLGQASLTAGITGRIDRYTCDAQPEILAAAAQHGGFVLIATQAADPDLLTPAGLMHAFASPMTLVGWAPL